MAFLDLAASTQELAAALRQLPAETRANLRRALVLADEPQAVHTAEGQLPTDLWARIIPAALGYFLNDAAQTCREWRQLVRRCPRRLYPVSRSELRGSKGIKFLQSGGVLMFCGNEIGPDGAVLLAALLEKSHVTKLELYDNEIGPSGVTALAAVLDKTRILTLDLGYNSVGDNGVAVLAEVLCVCPNIACAVVRAATLTLLEIVLICFSVPVDATAC